MTREEKATVIKDLTTQLADSATIYVADIESAVDFHNLMMP